jgi:hypothetical protein
MFRRGWIFGCAVAALAVAPSVAEARTVSMVGSVGPAHFDLRSGKPSPHFWALYTGTGLVRLAPQGVDPAALSGRRVRITGDLRNGRLAVGPRDVVRLGGRSRLHAASASRSTAVVILRFPDSPDDPSWAPTPSAARAAVFGSSATDKFSVRSYYATQTYGQVKLGGKVNPAGDVFGPYDIPNPSHDPSCQFSQWSYDGTNAAMAHDHVDLNSYQSVIYLFSTSRCSFAGLGGAGSAVWINGLNRYTINHEIGHTFGNPHASTLRCHSGAAAVPLSTTCDPYAEYGDPFDPMGSGGTYMLSQGGGGYESVAHEMEPWRKLQIGAIRAADAPYANTPGRYHLAPLERPSGVRMLRLPDGRHDGKFFDLSFRRPIGPFDSAYLAPDAGNPNAVKGVLVNWDTKTVGNDNSMLLDMTPSTTGGTVDPWSHQITTGFEDAPLAAGRSFHDPQSGLTLTVKSVGDLGADLTVAYTRGAVDVATPTVPGRPVAKVKDGKVKLSWSPSVDAFGVKRYIVRRNKRTLPSVQVAKAVDKRGPGRWRYTVRAVDAAGNVSPPSPARVVTIKKR